jgi:hypothetical protein
MSIPTPEFLSPSLSEAFERCKPTLDRFTVSLDAMSHDIKLLEESLSARGIRVHFSGDLKTHIFGEGCDASLSWAEDAQSKRWRLILRKSWNHPDCPDEVRPLIECPASDRMAVYPTLATWLEMLTEKVYVPDLVQHELPPAQEGL